MFSLFRVALWLIVSAGCFLLLVMLKGQESNLVIYVHSAPSLYEMSKLIQQQKQQLDHISKHPTVINTCSHDQPSIKYPRLASDKLTEIVMGTNDECGDSQSDAVIIIHSSASHFHRREVLRRAYGNYNVTKPYKIKVVFLIGSVTDANLGIQLEQENRLHGDTVVGVFLDVYQNLTLKAVMGFRWLTETCPKVKLLIKMDDDVFFDADKFFTNYWNKMPAASKFKSLHCVMWHNARVLRKGKWRVEKSLFANVSYSFPYCSGFFLVVSPDLIKPLYMHGKLVDFFWIDDVFLYGMVAEAIGDVHFHQVGDRKQFVQEFYRNFKKCIKKTTCPTWAVQTNGEAEFVSEFDNLLSKKMMNKTVENYTAYE